MHIVCISHEKNKYFCVQTFLLTKQNSNLNVSEVLLVTSGLVGQNARIFLSSCFSSLNSAGLIFKIIKLLHIAAIFLRIVFHSQIKGDLRISSIVEWC